MTAEKVKNYLKTKLSDGVSVIVNTIDDSLQECIGVFDPKTQEKRRRCIGGEENTKTQIRRFNILVHWTDSPVACEAKAREIMDLFDHKSGFDVDGVKVVAAEAEFPRWAGRAQNRVCEYVVPIKITYEEVKKNA